MSSPYGGKDKCYGKALFLLIIPGIPCLQYFIKEVLSCLQKDTLVREEETE